MTAQPWSTIPALIDHSAATFPDNEALVQDDVRLTFTELRERVHEATRALMARGIGPGDMVSIWAPNIWEWVVAGLAIHCSGAALDGVNTRWAVAVTTSPSRSSSHLAMPKSSSLAWPNWSTSTLAGLISRCTTS